MHRATTKAMSNQKCPTYTPAPELPTDPELRRRFAEIVAVLAQTQTVAGAARSLSLSRNHFQTILHRTIAAMIEAITPKPAGRPAKPKREVELEAENARLRAENEALTIRTDAIERMLSVVGGIASGRTPLPRSRAKKSKPDEDPEPARIRKQAVTLMREQGARTKLCAAALGVSASTVRRATKPCHASKPGPKRTALDCAKCERVRTAVRATHGLVGAQSLGRLTSLPRRICAEIKMAELRAIERDRKARCAAVTIASPGIVRGFDAMHVQSTEARAYWLVAADGAVPFRTTVTTVDSYDARNVIDVLRRDFETYGPPLVLRLDRISCQRTPDVDELLAHYQVLALHGPPHYPRYYGQLERQNREHRAWYAKLGPVTRAQLEPAADRMRTALNGLWPRTTLGGWTAEQAWHARKPLDVNRRQLRRDVDRCADQLVNRGWERLRARRIAIESALRERGLLSIKQGDWC